MNSTDEHAALMAALAASDEHRRAERAEHIMWLSANRKPRPAFMDRIEVSTLLDEAERCYVEGLFVATVICAAAYVEQALIGELLDRGVTTDTTIFAKPAFSLARDRRVLPDDLMSRIEAMARLRNSYAHIRDPEDATSFSARFLKAKTHPNRIREDDARVALGVMNAVFGALLRPATEDDLMGPESRT